jgi:heme oxygenase
MERFLNSEQLKIQTHQVHVDLEEALIPIIRSISSRSQYAELLKMFYTFYAPIEERLSSVPGIERLTIGLELRKADSLKKDITALGAKVDGSVLCSDLPVCADLSNAFGIMYVLEGSVLGGKAIANMVTKQLPTGSSLPFSFFLHYGDEARAKWQQFKTKLDSTEGLLPPRLLSAATETFILFKHWIEMNPASFSHNDRAGDRN